MLAGAGSGKTRVLTARIAHLVGDMGVPPENILAITFTNKAANEMRERLSAIADTRRMWVSTIHSMCVRILRMYADRRGLTQNFSIYSEQERSAVIKQAFKECNFEEESLLKSIKWHISNAKMLGLSPSEYAVQHRAERNVEEAVKVYEKYDAHLKQNNALDFDDLLTEARALLASDRDAREYLAGKFRYIHVDEFQDTNAVQFDIVKMLASVHGNLFVVGDDDQSIYGWRGAQIENILHFERTYPTARTFKLQQNYRSTKAILSLANASIAHNLNRKGKKLWTENEEGDKPVWYESDEETGEALYAARIIAELRCMRRASLRSFGGRATSSPILPCSCASTRSRARTSRNLPSTASPIRCSAASASLNARRSRMRSPTCASSPIPSTARPFRASSMCRGAASVKRRWRRCAPMPNGRNSPSTTPFSTATFSPSARR